MSQGSLYLLAADAILLVHGTFVAFVIIGLVLIYVGRWLNWHWIHNWWFRLLHVGAIAVVVLQSWLGIICPLTIWEMRLRELGGGETYQVTFIQYWLHTLLFYEAPQWVFILVYTLFGGLVIASWFMIPPARHRHENH